MDGSGDVRGAGWGDMLVIGNDTGSDSLERTMKRGNEWICARGARGERIAIGVHMSRGGRSLRRRIL